MQVPPPGGHLEGQLNRLGRADDLKAVVHPASLGQLQDGRQGVVLRRVDTVGGAKGFGEFELVVEQVNRNDLPRAGNRRALNHVQADPAAADHGDRAARLDLGGVNRRPDPGHRAAANKTGPVQGHVVADFNRAALVHDRLLGKRRGKGKVVNVGPVFVQTGRAVDQHAGGLGPGFAQVRTALGAVEAGAAYRVERQHNVVALLDRGHPGPDFLDHPGSLVAQDHGQGLAHVTGHHVQVAVAGAVGRDPDLDLTGLWRVEL